MSDSEAAALAFVAFLLQVGILHVGAGLFHAVGKFAEIPAQADANAPFLLTALAHRMG